MFREKSRKLRFHGFVVALYRLMKTVEFAGNCPDVDQDFFLKHLAEFGNEFVAHGHNSTLGAYAI